MNRHVLLAGILLGAIAARGQTVETVVEGLQEPYGIGVDLEKNTYYFTSSATDRLYSYTPGAGSPLREVAVYPSASQHIGVPDANPQGVAVSRHSVVVALSGLHQVERRLPNGTVIRIGDGNLGNDNGNATTASFNFPYAVAVDQAGNIFVADSQNNAIRKIDANNQVTTLATGVSQPTAIALSPNEQHIAVAAADRLFVLNTDGVEVATAAGLAANRGLLWVGGETGLLATHYQQHSIGQVGYGNSLSTEATVFSGGFVSGFRNGSFGEALFNEPAGMARTADGSILIADLKNGAIRLLKRSEVTLPDLSHASGVYTDEIPITFTSEVLPQNAQFRYTLDRKDPSPFSSAFLPGMTLAERGTNTSVTLKLRGFSPDANSSSVISNVYKFVVGPLALLEDGRTSAGGFFENDLSLNVESVTPGVTVRYTLDGKIPQETNAVWTDGAFGQTSTLQLRGFRVGYEPSQVLSNRFRFTVGDPAIRPAGGVYSNDVTVVVTNSTVGSTLRATYDGSEVTPATAGTVTNGVGFVLSGNEAGESNLVFRVAGFKDGYVASAEAAANFTFVVAPIQINRAGGAFNNPTNVMLHTDTEGAVIRYRVYPIGTTDLPSPTESDPVWVNGDYARDGILVARAFRPGYTPSTILRETFNFIVAPLQIDPRGGAFTNAMPVTVQTLTEQVTYRYRVYPHGTPNPEAPTETDPIWRNGLLAENGLFVVRAFRTGFRPSAVLVQPFRFSVAPLAINPAGGSYSNGISVTITTATDDAVIRFRTFPRGTLNPAPITENDPVWVNGQHAQDGLLVARGFRTNFEPSPALEQNFVFEVANPSINVASGTFNNTITVTPSAATDGATLRYTLDGTNPTSTSPEAVGPITISGNEPGQDDVTLKVVGFKGGFAQSPVAATATYRFDVSAPEVTADGNVSNGAYVNSATVSAGNETVGASNLFTLNGTAPVNSSEQFPAQLILTNMRPLVVAGFKANYNPSATVSNLFSIKAPRPVLSSVGGFFPSGTTVTARVDRADVELTYTTTGVDPSETDAGGSNPLAIEVNTLEFESADLRFLKVRAFGPGLLPSDVVGGEVLVQNTIGVPSDIIAGAGATVVVPVVLNLTSNQILRSLQFSVDVAPADVGRPNITKVRPLPISTNDFVIIRDGHLGSESYEVQMPIGASVEGPGGRVTNVLRYAILDTQNFGIRSYGLAALVAVRIPNNAPEGSVYTISVSNASGTEDGEQRSIALPSSAARKITVGSPGYLVGDTAPGVWYNAGDFGDGVIDNADVLNAFRASLDLRKPFWFEAPSDVSDAFNAMDAFPEDSATRAGGFDLVNKIGINDWQLLLERSLSGDRGWQRYWTNGQRVPVRASAAPMGALSALGASLEVDGKPPGSVWFAQAAIRAGRVENATPGQSVSVPVTIRVLAGQQVGGLQLRAIVAPVGSAPALQNDVRFLPADGVPSARGLDDLPPNNAVAAWDIGAFSPAIEGVKLLGHLRFTIPATSRAGDAYRVRFAGVGGAPDMSAEYQLESQSAFVTVLGSDTQQAEVASDEWRNAFFGSVDAPLAHAEGDPDNDGVSNSQEFRAGTHPLQAASRLALHRPEARGAGVALKFLSAPGKRYVIESVGSLDGEPWVQVGSGIAGDGTVMEIVDSTPASNGQFYRIRLAESAE